MYKFSVYVFDDKEIDQIVELVRRYSSGSTVPIDKRKVSRQVVEWGLNWNLLQRGQALRTWDGKTPWYVKKYGVGRVYLSSGVFSPRWNLPVEALWRLVKPMVMEHSGFSITKNRGWYDLNIYPTTDESHSERDLEEMWEILAYLHQYHYIRFSSAGNIWQIVPTPERAIRSED